MGSAEGYDLDRSPVDVSMMMMATSGIDWKTAAIMMLLVIIVIETLAILVLALTLSGRKFTVIVVAKGEERPAPEGPRHGDEVPPPGVAAGGVPPPGGAVPEAEAPGAAAAEDPPAPPVPPQEWTRITKFIGVTPTGSCFHNETCPTTRLAAPNGNLRILRGCNVCMP